MRAMLVGQAPSRDTDGRPPFTGRSGRRLAELAGVTYEDLPRVFELRNVFDRWPGRDGRGDAFPAREARRRASGMVIDCERVVFVGVATARAFGVIGAEPASWFSWRGVVAAVVPHPSGICRWWNDPRNVDAARRLLLEASACAG